METGKTLEALGLGLSRLLRYSYGGFLLIALASFLNPSDTKRILDAMSWQLAALSAVVLGAGIYAVHRSVVIPIHHALLCLVFIGFDKLRKIKAGHSSSPTRWLGSREVPLGLRILAYSALRQSDFFTEQERRALDVTHAEAGLVVMTAEGLAVAAVYALLVPGKSTIGWEGLVTLAIVVFVASYPGPFIQHRSECRRFQEREEDVEKTLTRLGFPFKSKKAAA